jgi:hypothetical protein
MDAVRSTDESPGFCQWSVVVATERAVVAILALDPGGAELRFAQLRRLRARSHVF